MANRYLIALLCGVVIAFTTACDKKANIDINYTNVINNYFYAHPACLWSASKQLPAQAETSDQSKTFGYDALVDQELLVRTTAEKKKFIVVSKQVNNYDLSDKGRMVWTADETQPGFGNFCYGHRKVSSIDSSTRTTSAVGATTQVNYHYTFINVPNWANAAEIQNTYSQVRADLAGPHTGSIGLINTKDGWQVAPASDASNPATNPDSQIVK